MPALSYSEIGICLERQQTIITKMGKNKVTMFPQTPTEYTETYLPLMTEDTLDL